MTSHCSYRSLTRTLDSQPQQEHASTAESRNQQRLKINNFNAHPCITIRWPAAAGQDSPTNMILKRAGGRGRGCSSC
jgi:hypothetical protein